MVYSPSFLLPHANQGFLPNIRQTEYAIWLLTTNDSLLVTSSSPYVCARLGWAAKAHVLCQDLTASYFQPRPQMCPRPEPSFWKDMSETRLKKAERKKQQQRQQQNLKGAVHDISGFPFSRRMDVNAERVHWNESIAVTFPLEQLADAKIPHHIPKLTCSPSLLQYRPGLGKTKSQGLPRGRLPAQVPSRLLFAFLQPRKIEAFSSSSLCPMVCLGGSNPFLPSPSTSFSFTKKQNTEI